jgi:hypothetical protein
MTDATTGGEILNLSEYSPSMWATEYQPAVTPKKTRQVKIFFNQEHLTEYREKIIRDCKNQRPSIRWDEKQAVKSDQRCEDKDRKIEPSHLFYDRKAFPLSRFDSPLSAHR